MVGSYVEDTGSQQVVWVILFAHLTHPSHDLQLTVVSGRCLEFVLSPLLSFPLHFFMQGETWVCEGAVTPQVDDA